MRPPARLGCIGAALVFLVQLAGCATSTVVTSSMPNAPAPSANCRASVIDRGGAVPAGYQEVAKIESHIKRNFFFGGPVTLLDEAYKELRAKACEVGGDHVRVDDFVESAAAEMTHVHVWATVFRRREVDIRRLVARADDA
jgi:hypothetical protein